MSMEEMLRALPRNTEERQVQAVRRRLFEATYAGDVQHLCTQTGLARTVVVDALILCADTVLPQVAVYSWWTEWSGVMAGTGSSEYRSFPHYLQDKVRAARAEKANEENQ